MRVLSDKPNGSRSAAQKNLFDMGLRWMHFMYGHQHTHVWCLTKMPENESPYHDLPGYKPFQQYHRKGWPTFEFAMAGLISLAGRMLDIGILLEDKSAPDITALSYSEIARICEARRKPPVIPMHFTEVYHTDPNSSRHATHLPANPTTSRQLLETKTFTNGKDEYHKVHAGW
jgi:hypothetical protein